MTEASKRTAIFVRDVSEEFTGRAYLYRVSPPVAWVEWAEGGRKRRRASWIIVSATAFLGAETYLFPANQEGRIRDWNELDGSRNGTLDIEGTLRAAGYEVKEAQ